MDNEDKKPIITGIESLDLKEQMAIEFRYLGLNNGEIAKRVDVAVGTIGQWFCKGGKLFDYYEKYHKVMTEARQKRMQEKLALSDDELFAVSTNTVRRYAEQQLNPKRKVPLRNKFTGDIVYDKETGDPIMVDYYPNIKFSDVAKAFEMQRIMRNLPTSYQKQDVTQTSYEADVIIKELGLTEEDFDDEHKEATSKRILDYLATK